LPQGGEPLSVFVQLIHIVSVGKKTVLLKKLSQIDHVMNNKDCVGTKEKKVTSINSSRIKIPSVCDNMGIRWINDFQLIEELNIQFSCKIP